MSFTGMMFVFAGLILTAGHPPDYEKNWHQWRGPFQNGISPDGDPPLEWSETKNIKWKIEIPGRGHATPIIWENRMFVLTAVDTGGGEEPSEANGGQQRGRGMSSRKTTNPQKFVVMSINRLDGSILWEKTVKEEVPQEATHDFGS